MSNPSNFHADINVSNERFFEAAFDKIAPELDGIRPEDLLQINVDIPAAVATALGALPRICAQRELVQAALPQFDTTLFEKLEDYALALHHAHARCATAGDAPDELPTLAQEASDSRDRLRADVRALVQRGLVSDAVVADCCWLNGYKNVATDLTFLVTGLKDAWPRIQAKCAIDAAELERAERVAARMLRLVGTRQLSPVAESDAADRRARVYTLFMKCYEDIRRAIGFLRWTEGDVDTIMPTLYNNAKKRKAPHQPEAKPTTQPEPAPVAPTPAPAIPGGSPYVS
jgi:hypothetical protein